MRYLLPHIFINTVKNNKNKIALIIDQREYSYQEMYVDCLQLTYHLKYLGAVRHDRILIQAGNSYLTMIAFWSSLLCECVPCIVDSEIDLETLSELIKSIDPKMAVLSDNDRTKQDHFDDLKINVIHHIDAVKNFQEIQNDFIFKNTEQDLAMLMHTSGSTGIPKGVMLSHRNVLAAVDSISHYLSLESSDIILSVLPLHFDYGLYQMLLCFSLGATLVLEKNFLFPNIISKKINQYCVTVLPCIPLMVQLLYISCERYLFNFPTVRMVTNTGENLSAHHIKKLKKLFPTARIFSMYGLTECKRCSYVPPDHLDEKLESIGIPMLNIEMWIQDSDGNILESNKEGELVISGPTVMLGYWKNISETNKKININKSGKRILMTGDRAIVDDDGYFYFKGRNDFIVKFKGTKLNCLHYTKILSKITFINRSYIFLSKSNFEDQKLIVCVEVDSFCDHIDNLRKLIFSYFPSIQKPDYVYFIDQFPSLSNGKMNKHLLEKKASENIVCI